MPTRREARDHSATSDTLPAHAPRSIPLGGLLLTLILIAAAGLRLYNLSGLGYWTDEFCTLSTAHGWGLEFLRTPMDQIVGGDRPAVSRFDQAKPWRDIIPAIARDDAHPPLYILLVRLCESVTGDDAEAQVRSIGILFSVAAVALLYFVARAFVNASAALWACLLLAVMGPQIEFSQEAGRYMPLVTFALAVALCLAKLRRGPSIRWTLLLGICALAMPLTHYFAVG